MDRRLRRRVGDQVTDDAVDLLGPLDGKGPDEQLADAARRLPLLGTPYAEYLAFTIRRIGIWARRTAHPGPESEDLVQAIEKRLSSIAARLGDDE